MCVCGLCNCLASDRNVRTQFFYFFQGENIKFLQENKKAASNYGIDTREENEEKRRRKKRKRREKEQGLGGGGGGEWNGRGRIRN